jgi:alkyl sulfatase BDS1-like metallo-beta-lactamase superfamily hydrolase
LSTGPLQSYESRQDPDANVSLSMTVAEFVNIAEGAATIDDEIKSGKITLTGNQSNFDQFPSVFDTFDAWYNVVMPVDSK